MSTTYQNLDVRICPEGLNSVGLPVNVYVASVVEEADILFLEHSPNDASEFGPVDED